LRIDTADCEPRLVATQVGGDPYQLQARSRAPRLGRCGPAWADAEIVAVGGPETGGRRGNWVGVVGRQADQRVRPDDLPRHAQRQVALTQVECVGTGRADNIGAVVDCEQRSVPAGRVREDLARCQLVARLERAEPLLTDRTFVAQLDDVHAAGQGGVGEPGQVAVLTAGVGTQIQPRRRETGSRFVHTATLAR